MGARVRSQEAESWREIVGVVADSKYGFYGEAPQPIVYSPYLQTGGNLWVVARTPASPAAMIPAVKRALGEVDRTATGEVRTIRDVTSLEFSIRRMGTWLLGAIGGLGLALALVGLYGVMSYTVHRRTAEIGVRMALGATRTSILWMVLRNGVAQVAAGVGIGTAISLAATRPMAFLMSGITTADPLTITATAALLLGAGLAASYFPARRATRVDPMILLRQQ
jgi:ABC-type lipoprotein release transport system permease subunit